MTTMNLLLSSLLMLVAGCNCAPATYGGGGKIGFRNVFDIQAGGRGKITRDGFALDGIGSGLFGFKETPELYGGVYGQAGDKMYAADGILKGNLAGYWNPSIHAAGGINSEGSMPLAFEPRSRTLTDMSLTPYGAFHTGKEARDRAAMYGGPMYQDAESPIAGLKIY